MQENSFDYRRAHLAGKPMFEPFYVKKLRPLHTHIQNGAITDDTQLLVTERSGGVIALHTRQMAYHHIAQGEMIGEPNLGEPWLVAF